ncbi:SigE family RNA polymerase sigma factor [Catenulispora subtropica]|uniref:SigE family RNA polymerase sigma factor n=1 Tax=Catenulispora subtropica TaxID=450798 RepID=UPI0031DB53E1
MREPDEAEFTAVVAARAHSLRRLAYLMCGDWHRAEDLVQNVFLNLYRNWARVQRRDRLDAYLRTSLMRAAVDAGRHRTRREQPFGEVPDSPAPPDPGCEDRDALLAALSEVAPGQRAVLVLRYWEDLSVEETAAILGLSSGTVKSQAARGLTALRGVLARPAFSDFHDK